MFETPILFLVFNRPDLTRIVFNRIKEIKPKYFFIAADGPRAGNNEDSRKCQEVRSIILDNIDWNCEVITLFRDQNLGCGKAVSEAITWFFRNVEMGIILEDDCLPSLSFFGFCEDLLKYYKDDERVMMISGTNLLGKWETKYDYFFSQIGAVWGWATWKKSWKLYDFQLEKLENSITENVFEKVLLNPIEVEKRTSNLRMIKQGKIDTWDYQWTFARLINNGLTAIPSKNLITNIGYGIDATHTILKNDLFSNLNSFNINDSVLSHPIFIVPEKKFDDIISKMIYPPLQNNRIKHVFKLKSLKTNILMFLESLKINFRIPKATKLHLGCGGKKIQGWLNIDLSDSDFNVDLSKGRLPFTSNKIEYVVSQHFIEHIKLDSELLPLLKEVYRVLKPGGELWLSTPSIEKICNNYIHDKGRNLLKNRIKRFPAYSLNGRPISHIINEIFYQQGEHKNLFDFEILQWALGNAGFKKIKEESESTFINKFSEFPVRYDDDVSIYCSAIK